MKRSGMQIFSDRIKLLLNDIRSIKWALIFISVCFVFFEITAGSICPVYALTGYPCPGCGLTRAGICVLRLDFAGAWELNPFIFPIGILLAAYAVNRYILKAFCHRKSDRPIQGEEPPERSVLIQSKSEDDAGEGVLEYIGAPERRTMVQRAPESGAGNGGLEYIGAPEQRTMVQKAPESGAGNGGLEYFVPPEQRVWKNIIHGENIGKIKYMKLPGQNNLRRWLDCCAVLVLAGLIIFYVWRMISCFPGEPPMVYNEENLSLRLFRMMR